MNDNEINIPSTHATKNEVYTPKLTTTLLDSQSLIIDGLLIKGINHVNLDKPEALVTGNAVKLESFRLEELIYSLNQRVDKINITTVLSDPLLNPFFMDKYWQLNDFILGYTGVEYRPLTVKFNQATLTMKNGSLPYVGEYFLIVQIDSLPSGYIDIVNEKGQILGTITKQGEYKITIDITSPSIAILEFRLSNMKVSDLCRITSIYIHYVKPVFSSYLEYVANMFASGGTGFATTGYVDQGDASTLDNAKTYTDMTILNLNTRLNSHTNDTNNPHGTTIAQIGAAPKVHTHKLADISDVGDTLSGLGDLADKVNTHVANENNPHKTSYDQVGAAPTVHTHVYTDLTGVAASKHNHEYIDLTGVAAIQHGHSAEDISGINPSAIKSPLEGNVNIYVDSITGDDESENYMDMNITDEEGNNIFLPIKTIAKALEIANTYSYEPNDASTQSYIWIVLSDGTSYDESIYLSNSHLPIVLIGNATITGNIHITDNSILNLSVANIDYRNNTNSLTIDNRCLINVSGLVNMLLKDNTKIKITNRSHLYIAEAGNLKINNSTNLTNYIDTDLLSTWSIKNNDFEGYLPDKLDNLTSSITTHSSNTNNPHSTTASQVGAYTKSEADTLLNTKANTSTTYTKTDINGLLNNKANKTDVYTASQTDTLLDTKSDIATTYTKTQVNTLLDSKADEVITMLALPASSGNITLQDRSMYYGTLTAVANFTLPTIAAANRYKQHQIKLYFSQTATLKHTWGTNNEYNDMTDIESGGNICIYWDFDPVLNQWVVGYLKKV